MESIHIYIPTRNSELTLENSVTSLSASATACQVNIKITIVDNMSSDGTWERILSLEEKGLVHRSFRHPSNIGIATLLYCLSMHKKEINLRGSYMPLIMIDSEDTVNPDFFSYYSSFNSTKRADLYIPRYGLYRINGSNENHFETGTNSFYANCGYLSPISRAMAILALPGAIGSTTAVWATGIMSNEAFEIWYHHTRKFVKNPGIPLIAWENSLIANLLYQCSYRLTEGLCLRGCIDSKYIRFPGVSSQLATVLYEMNCGGLELLSIFTEYKLLNEDLLEKISSVDSYRKSLRTMIHGWK